MFNVMGRLGLLACLAGTLLACGGGGGAPDEPPAQVATIMVSASGGSMRVGQTQTVSAEARDSQGAVVPGVLFTWATSNAAVASVADGVVTALAPGIATITAASDAVTTGSMNMNVLAAAAGSIVLDRPIAFFSAIGQSAALSARVFDEQGVPSTGPVTWRSSAPDKIAVDASGQLVALAVGSAQITAESAGLRSPPTLAIVAEPKAGALLVTDAQVLLVGAPLGLATGGVAGVGAQYEVTLQGVAAPAVGTVVLAAETAPVAGKVVGTRQEAAGLVVTLAIAPLPQLFSNYDLRFNIDLSAFPMQEVTAQARANKPTVIWDSRAQRLSSTARRLSEESAFAPFRAWKCDGSVKAQLLGEPPIQLSLTRSLKLVLEDRPGYSKHALEGSATIEGSAGFKLKVGFTAAGKCDAQGQIKLPVLGWISALVMPAVRFGIGAELKGSVTVAQAELGIAGSIAVNTVLGWECGGAEPGCRALERGLDASIENKFETKSKLPSVNDMEAEISAHFYVVAGLDASILFGSINAGIVEARIGPKQSFNLAFEDDQIVRTDYASSYDLKFVGIVEPGAALAEAIKAVIDDGAIGVEFKGGFSSDISQSPKGRFNMSKTRTNPGSGVDFTVDFAPPDSVDYFLLGYNVMHVQLYRKRDNETEFTNWKSMERVSSNNRFHYRWTPELADAGKYEFAAMVNTQLVTPLLEIEPNSRKTLEVSCFSIGKAGTLAAGQCVDKWFGTASGLTRDVSEFTATLTWELDPERNAAPGRPPTALFYRPTGVVRVTLLVWTQLGCTVTPHSFDRFDTSSMLMVDAATSPPSYVFGVSISSDLTIVCPGTPPIVIPGTRVLAFNGSGTLNESGAIEGSNVTPQGTMTWGFSHGPPPQAAARR